MSSYKYDDDVVQILEESDRAMSAYDLADAISTQDRKRTSAVSVYRSLQRLVAKGEVVRLASRNAFSKVPSRRTLDQNRLLIICCEHCERLELIWTTFQSKLEEVARSRAFKIAYAYIECLAVCRRCAMQPV